MNKKWYYTKNTELLNSWVNIKFETVLWADEENFKYWVKELRKEIVRIWDEHGTPPRVGYSETEIVDDFNTMIGYPIHDFLTTDEFTGEKNVIRNVSNVGNASCQWFPTIMKTRINYSVKDTGKSIYDYFAQDALYESFCKYAARHFKRDSFYHYSTPAKPSDYENVKEYPVVKTGKEWIQKFEASYRQLGTHDYWLNCKENDAEYTGYNEELKGQVYLSLTKQEVEELGDLIPSNCKTNINWEKSNTCQIRHYKYGQKLFPVGLKAFRVSFAQIPAQFPPLTARFLYENYIRGLETQSCINIFDPSAGWGGRILGAMSISDNYTVHFIGTDPNRDHDTYNGRTKYHELADFFNDRTYRGNNLYPKTHTYEIFQDGSEEIKNNPKFQKYKGKLDLVFTSPPYFNREAYSEDETQSYKKFGTYASWRDGFLRPTLETCVEYLKKDRYLLWNVADVKVGKDYLPIETDSKTILESLGMRYVKTWKMSLMGMPGANRTGDDDSVTTKNFVKVKEASGKGKLLITKFEPVLVFYKP